MFVYRMNELAKDLPASGLTGTRCTVLWWIVIQNSFLHQLGNTV